MRSLPRLQKAILSCRHSHPASDLDPRSSKVLPHLSTLSLVGSKEAISKDPETFAKGLVFATFALEMRSAVADLIIQGRWPRITRNARAIGLVALGSCQYRSDHAPED